MQIGVNTNEEQAPQFLIDPLVSLVINVEFCTANLILAQVITTQVNQRDLDPNLGTTVIRL